MRDSVFSKNIAESERRMEVTRKSVDNEDGEQRLLRISKERATHERNATVGLNMADESMAAMKINIVVLFNNHNAGKGLVIAWKDGKLVKPKVMFAYLYTLIQYELAIEMDKPDDADIKRSLKNKTALSNEVCERQICHIFNNMIERGETMQDVIDYDNEMIKKTFNM